jgi:hypothetical protein
VPDVDYMIDLRTGVMTPLPKSHHPIGGQAGRESSAAVRGPARWIPARLPRDRRRREPSDLRRRYRRHGDPPDDAASDACLVARLVAGRHEDRLRRYGYGSEGVRNLFVLDVATGWPALIAAAVRPMAQPQFTPDGSSLLYTDFSSGHAALRTVPIAGGKSTVLIGPREGMGHAGNGALSPDGSLVTMMGNEIGGPGALRFVANADGTELRSIPVGGSNPAGTWSPDGSRIVCSDYSGKDIIVVDVATGEASRVARGAAAIWLDGHTLLVEV